MNPMEPPPGPPTEASTGPQQRNRLTATAPPSPGTLTPMLGLPPEPTAATSVMTTAKPGSRSTPATGTPSACPGSWTQKGESPSLALFQPKNDSWVPHPERSEGWDTTDQRSMSEAA